MPQSSLMAFSWIFNVSYFRMEISWALNWEFFRGFSWDFKCFSPWDFSHENPGINTMKNLLKVHENLVISPIKIFTRF